MFLIYIDWVVYVNKKHLLEFSVDLINHGKKLVEGLELRLEIKIGFKYREESR